MADTAPLGLGLIGCGAFGQFCLEAFKTLDSVQAVAVADVRKDAADALGGLLGLRAYGSVAELIADPAVDLVHIATPPSSHHELVLAAAKAGKHVLCEKPLAMNLAQADEMLQAVATAGTICPVDFVLRYNRATDVVKAIIDSGALGDCLSARLTNCAADSNLPPAHWFWDRKISGGIFIEHGVHFFDLYDHWLGEGRVLDAHTETREPAGQQDRVMCTVRHESGAVVSHYHAFDQAGPMDRTEHRLIFELGDVRVDGWIPLQIQIDAAVSEQSLQQLIDCCGHCDAAVVEQFDAGKLPLISRGSQRDVDRRVRIDYCPEPDKQRLYADSVRDLLADQVAMVLDPVHDRRVTEANGRRAVAMAQEAIALSEQTPNS